MIEKAIEKIKAEINKNNSPYIKVIGNYVLSQIEVNKASAEGIINGNKTLKGSIKAMASEAKKRAVNNVGILTDEEGFAIVSQYFEFEATQITAEEAISNSKIIKLERRTDKNESKKLEVDFDFSLEDFLK